MAAITAGVITAGAGLYSANRQASAAEDASRAQAQGVANAQAISQRNMERALPILDSSYASAQGMVGAGGNQAINSIRGGISDARTLLGGGFDAANDNLTSYFGGADRALRAGFDGGINTLQPTATQGNQASRLQAALSGALGPDAQSAAFDNYVSSPGQQFLRDQQEQALLRNETALGGGLTANGRVMTALQDQAFGRAQTDFDNQFSRLGQIASRGDQANQSIAQLQASLGGTRSNLQTQLGQLLAGLDTSRAGSMAGLTTAEGQQVSGVQRDVASQIAQLLAGSGTAQANTLIGQGTEQAQLAQNLGQAQSGAGIFRSQQTPGIVQALNAGVGAYTGMGGDFSGLAGFLGGSSPPPGGYIGDYTGPAMQNWVGRQ